ncbi:MAG TPA: FtsX-like permease family protein [Candidatus Paceibacterota bacterium]|nr:FtsX-like permease family protein [Candidatus Paceibacterota bacterium]HOK94450.1 FtsX-like permease family protein [Candidatus Pacearchaeota archaeon]HPQ23096.1 FtsX-like permease family protein [Candidatus Paceibacterota bacterium]
MGKFITEGKKEIGILRAVGATKSDIKKIFITQAFIYVLIGYLIGLILGVGLNFAIASPAKTWFDSFINQTIKESFGVANPVSTSIFSNINLQALGIYTAILLVITILVSLILATKASNISPVEAIRSNE